MQVRMLRCRAILFDLDGVLVDSAERVEKTWREWAARHHLDAELVIAAAHGRRTVETVALVAPDLSADAELRALETSEATNSDGIYEIAGARDLLQQLPPERWAVVTSGIRAVAEFRIRHTGLPMPAIMICAEEISRGKPDPEGYLAAAEQLGVSPSDCVVIEDAPPGIEAAKAAGMRAIAIATTYPPERLEAADLIVTHLADLSVATVGDDIQITWSTNASKLR
jgi:mannitol-1-/sugar-/sorbitol-6-phosphatase